MASPRRARSLFLSPDKAELLAAREINNLVHRVEMVPRKSVPRQGRRTDIVVQTDSGDESRMSTTSTIKAVDTFCKEYRPPSVALHRLSYLDKELPPPPPPETPTQNLHQSNALNRTSTQKHAAAQTIISIHSRYSTRIKPSTPSRLSTISSQQRDSEDRVSIRSRFSTQDFPIDNAVPRCEPRASVAIDRRRPSGVWDHSEKHTRQISGSRSPGTVPDQEIVSAAAGREIQVPGSREVDHSKKDMRRQDSDSISPGTAPHQGSVSAEAGREIQVAGLREAEVAPRALQISPQAPVTGTKSKEIVPRSDPKRKASVGWTFHDGLILRNDDKIKSAIETSFEGENPALALELKSLIPIRWTFHEGIIFRAGEPPKNENGTSEAKSKRMFPIGWSFYDGITIRPDGSVKAISIATGKSEEIVHQSKSRRMVPIGWTFHEGLIFATDDSVKRALNSSDHNNDIEMEARSKRLPITWNFHDGLILRTDAKVNDAIQMAPSNGAVAPLPKSKRTVGWTFNDGLIIRNGAGMLPNNGELATRTRSKRTITWTFDEGLVIKTKAGTTAKTRNLATGSISKRTIGWTFHDGLTIRRDGGVVKRSSQSRGMATSTKSTRMPIGWSFYDRLTIKQRSTSKGKGKGVDRNLHPLIPRSKSVQKRRITYNFWDGVTFRTVDGSATRVSTQPESTLTWSFYDGITRRTMDGASGQVSTQPKRKRMYGWTFNDGITIQTVLEAGTLPKASPSLRRPKPIAPATSPSPQTTAKGIPDLPDEQHLDLPSNQDNVIEAEILPTAASSIRSPKSIASSPTTRDVPDLPDEQHFEFFPNQSGTKTISNIPHGSCFSAPARRVNPFKFASGQPSGRRCYSV